MKKFDLFMGCLGNGITVFNKAVIESGDFQKIAHISENGTIKFYVDVQTIPGKDLLRIEHQADVLYQKNKR